MLSVKLQKDRKHYPSIHVIDGIHRRSRICEGNKAIAFAADPVVINYLKVDFVDT